MTNFALAIPSWNAFSAAALCLRIRSSSASRSSFTVKDNQPDFFLVNSTYKLNNIWSEKCLV